MLANTQITVTDQDLMRLHALLAIARSDGREGGLDLLDAELSRAEVVASRDVPPDVVTMNSRVLFEDEETGQRREITLVYPHESDVQNNKISIFAPLGSALIGLSAGQSIEWPMPGGRVKRYRILALPYQPEAAGNYEL
jgi:regulator of nucleoside diphosphate kinase